VRQLAKAEAYEAVRHWCLRVPMEDSRKALACGAFGGYGCSAPRPDSRRRRTCRAGYSPAW
jgi:hypothetical protein